MLGSHNSWSYLKPKKWWMKLCNFAAKCQDVDIYTQYEKYGVRCFDLRVKFDKNQNLVIAHNHTVYNITQAELNQILKYLHYKANCYVRVIHEVRTAKEYNKTNRTLFNNYCHNLEKHFSNIKFWCGKNLYTWTEDYMFINQIPECIELYGSVTKPKWFGGLWPKLWAKLNNKQINKNKYNDCILLVDFVNLLK